MPGDRSFEIKTILVVLMFVVVGTDAAGCGAEGNQGPAENSKRWCICGWNPQGLHACTEAARTCLSQWKSSVPTNGCDTGDSQTVPSPPLSQGSRAKTAGTCAAARIARPAGRDGSGIRTSSIQRPTGSARENMTVETIWLRARGRRRRFVEILRFSQNKLWLTLSLILCL